MLCALHPHLFDPQTITQCLQYTDFVRNPIDASGAILGALLMRLFS